MSEEPARLCDEFVVCYTRGEQPDALEYLERAGDDADELAEVLEIFLSSSTPPSPRTETVRMFAAWIESVHSEQGLTPLAVIRQELTLTADAVVTLITERFNFETTKRPKVESYYIELEEGLLEPKRIDQRLLDVLCEAFNAHVGALLGLQRSAMMTAPGVGATAAPHRSPLTSAEPASPEWDEVDDLFRGATS